MTKKDMESLLPIVGIGVGLYFLYSILKPVAEGAGYVVAGAGNVVGAVTTGVSDELNNASDLITAAFHPIDSVTNWVESEF